MIMAIMNTTISLKPETKRLLDQIGTKGETYDELIRRLVSLAAVKEADKRWNRILREDEFIPLDDL